MSGTGCSSWYAALVACALSALACRAATEAGPPAAEAGVAATEGAGTAFPAQLAAAFYDRCQADCERRRQMQAVGAEVISAGCRSDCEAAWGTPLIEDRAQLEAHAGQDVRALGRLVRRDGGFDLELRDRPVPLEADALRDELETEVGRRVLLLGRIAETGGTLMLESVSLVVSAEGPAS